MAKQNEIKFLTTQRIEKFLNEQGRMLPRRITGNSLKYQRKVSQAIKKARQMALLPYVTDLLK
jgi:small subunit ribosomal protein S18